MTVVDKLLGGKRWCCLDFESNGLLELSEKGPAATKIWVMGYWDYSMGSEVKYTTDTDEMKVIIDSYDVVFVHNGFLFDTLLTEKLIGYSFNGKIFDTLSLSFYLYPARLKHGLKEWGVDLGVIKPSVDDWTDQPIEVYINRVVEDVKIQSNVAFKFSKDLLSLYDEDAPAALNLWEMLNSMYDLYNEQYKNPFYLDIELLEKNIAELTQMKLSREDELSKVMPPIPIVDKKSIPKVLYKKDGSLSSHGVNWYKLLDSLGADSKLLEVKYITGYKPPNPSSPEQVKDWLFSIGWEPEIFKDSINVKGEVNKVPQTKNKDGDLCKSVSRLSAQYPEIKVLEDLSVINHRLSVLNGFMENKREDNTIYGSVTGITNTIRSRHKILVNIPKMSAKYGHYIRPCLIPNLSEGEVLIGADLSSLENFCRTNLICGINPDSITELLDPEFDTHLDLAKFAGRVTDEEIAQYKYIKKEKDFSGDNATLYARVDAIRHIFKTCNYAALYGIGATKLAKELGITKKEAMFILESYWNKNYAVKLCANSAPVKSHLGITWIYNSIVKIWFRLKSEKDKFSSLNQGLGSIIFYMWVREVRSHGVKVTLNMHDEIQCRTRPEDVENKKQILLSSIDKVNKILNLTVPIRIEIEVGNSYGATH